MRLFVSRADQRKKQEQKEESGEAGLVDVTSVKTGTSPGQKAVMCITVMSVEHPRVGSTVVSLDFFAKNELKSAYEQGTLVLETTGTVVHAGRSMASPLRQ